MLINFLSYNFWNSLYLYIINRIILWIIIHRLELLYLIWLNLISFYLIIRSIIMILLCIIIEYGIMLWWIFSIGSFFLSLIILLLYYNNFIFILLISFNVFFFVFLIFSSVVFFFLKLFLIYFYDIEWFNHSICSKKIIIFVLLFNNHGRYFFHSKWIFFCYGTF